MATIKEKKITAWELLPFSFKANEFEKIVDFYIQQKVNVIIDNEMHSLSYCELIAKTFINIFPHFSNVKDADGMIKLLMINN